MNLKGKAAPPVELLSLLHTAYAAQAEVESKLDTVGLSLAKLLALKALADGGGSLPLGQLAERLSCVKSNVTQLVDRLEADGLVSRAADPNDRRSRLAVLTDAGREAYQKGRQIQIEAEEALFGALTADESATLHTLLAKLKG
jgi:DNA-binding MarR family transcriptional regulator